MTTMATTASAAGLLHWESMWAPYDEAINRQVLNWVDPTDTVLDIGAGDLRLAHRLAGKVRRVYAIEQNQSLATLPTWSPPAGNLTLIWGDAYRVPFPAGITTGLLLMRHCQGISTLADKLRSIGCRRLITNARWRVGVELIDLFSQPTPYATVAMGWYACRCGATGFVEGPPEKLTPQVESAVHEVISCPACQQHEYLIK